MKEFMLLIRNDVNSKATFSPEEDRAFLEACRVYIEKLTKNGNMISAQPLVREGKMLSGGMGSWQTGPFSESKEVIVGYYHIKTNNIDEALEIAKGNPEFAYTTAARVEVRPIKMKEEATAYVYPKGSNAN
ncbi:MAG: hypothetical protein NVSMB24_36390 [Mucilaginibacter sp.]